MTKSRKRLIWILSILAVLIVLVAASAIALYLYSVEQNKTIQVTPYTVTDEKIPASFEGKRIVHLSDLHNKDFNGELARCVKAQQPDIILITGDWISRRDTDITAAKQEARELVDIAPTYFVAGNHEAWAPLWSELSEALAECGVYILSNESVLWEEEGEAIQLLGMFDTEFSTHIIRDAGPFAREDLYTVFLFHRPEYVEQAAEFEFDLMLSGHTHGGQMRLPLIGSVYAPNQGWFPKYDVGRFEVDDLTMIVTQGLGEATAMRILTPPEVVVVTLDSPHV